MRVVGSLVVVALVGCKSSGEIDLGEDTDPQAQVGDIAVSPTSIDLGLIFVGQSATADITVTNVGSGEVDVRLEVIGGKATAYTLSAYTAAPGPEESSVHTLSLTPTTWGDHAVSVLVDDTLDEEGAVEISVTASVQVDADADGFGSAESGGEDCDDANAAVNPGAAEVWYDTVDQDCAGDDDFDQDADGHRADVDCDDTDATAYPGAPDAWYDGVDSDCADDSDYDQDLDGYDSTAHGGTDCDDLDAAVNTASLDIWYDGLDTNCDGANDYDQDGDGSNLGDDCDDEDATSYPGADEIWYDGVDQACDGGDDYDQDGDGVDYPTDCNDTDPATTGPEPEVFGDGVDNDCNGAADDANIDDIYAGVLYGYSTSMALGQTGYLSMGGDVSGNGTPDVVVSTDQVGYGYGWVVDGASAVAAAGSVANYDSAAVSESTYYFSLGLMPTVMKDADGDGTDDWLVVTQSSYADSGVYLFSGAVSGSLTGSSADAYFSSETDSDPDGIRVVTVADIDGDGVAEVVIGAPDDGKGGTDTPTDSGTLVAFDGSDTGDLLFDDAEARTYEDTAYANLGDSLASADLDDDGYDDLIVGAPGGGADGTVYLVSGAATTDWDASIEDFATAIIEGASGYDIGADVIPVPGDVDGDGALDIALASEADGGVWLYLGAGGLTGTVSITDADHAFTGTAGDFGSSLVIDSDLDGDGADDIAIGNDGGDMNGADSGGLYVFGYSSAWSTSVTSSSAMAAISGSAAGDYLGTGMAGGADLDGDGKEDLAVGATQDDGGVSNGGAVYIVLGW